MDIKMDKMKIKDLISPEFNPRTITKEEMEKLKQSITEYGYIEPIIVNKHNNHIIGGNQRAKALEELGETEVDVIYVDFEDLEQEKMASIALNKISGDWDEEKLTNIFKELVVGEADLNLTGFDEFELETYIAEDLDFDLEIEEEDPVKEVVFVEKEVEVEKTEKNVSDDSKIDKNNDDDKKLVKKEVNIVEEYETTNEVVYSEENDFEEIINEEEEEEQENTENIVEEKKEKYVPYPHIPTPNYFPLAPIKKLIRDAGAERVSDGACKLLGNVLEENAKQISEKAVMMANVAGRKTVLDKDFEIILNS